MAEEKNFRRTKQLQEIYEEDYLEVNTLKIPEINLPCYINA